MDAIEVFCLYLSFNLTKISYELKENSYALEKPFGNNNYDTSANFFLNLKVINVRQGCSR